MSLVVSMWDQLRFLPVHKTRRYDKIDTMMNEALHLFPAYDAGGWRA